MRKIICFSALLLTASFASFAQTTRPAASAAAVPSEHCILVATGADYGRVQLNYGRTMKDDSKNEAMAETDRMVRKLGTAVAALNYLSSQGWECIGVTTVATGTNGSGGSQTDYLMRRAK